MKVKSKDELAVLTRIKQNDEVKEAIPKQRQDRPQIQVKSICLLVAYMHGKINDDDFKIETIREDLEQILRSIPSFMEILLSQTMQLAQAFKMG